MSNHFDIDIEIYVDIEQGPGLGTVGSNVGSGQRRLNARLRVPLEVLMSATRLTPSVPG